MKKVSFAEMRCSLARALEQMGDWWTPLIVRDIYLGVDRFDDLVADLGISRNLLTARLKALEKNGILQRIAYQQKPARYAYGLTDMGRDLIPALLALTAWGDRWVAPEEGRPMLLRHRQCSHHFRPQVTCSVCEEPIRAADVVIEPGPGGAALPGTMVIAKRLAQKAR